MTGNTFDVLERSIPRDVSDNARYGANFELVSDYALTRSPEYGAHIARIEPYGDWAARNGRARTDLSVDRVITTITGELWTVQNKGYSADRRVDLNDFNNFIIASATMPNVTRRLLVTSGPGLGRNAAEVAKHQGVAVNVTVLNRARLRTATTYPTTWGAFVAESGNDPEGVEPFRLRPHQLDAIHDVTSSLRSVPECQLISTCGTGKTITSVGIADSLGVNTLVYFVPGLGVVPREVVNG